LHLIARLLPTGSPQVQATAALTLATDDSDLAVEILT